MDIFQICIIVAGAAIVLGTVVQAVNQGRAIVKAVEGISRQPEASGPITTNLIIGLAFIESLSIYVLVVVLLLIFANPFTKPKQEMEQAKAEVTILELSMEKMQLEFNREQLAEKLKIEREKLEGKSTVEK